MRRLQVAALCVLACGAGIALAAEPTRMVPAFVRKPANGEINTYPTRTLGQLADFRAQATPADQLDVYGGLKGVKEKVTGFFYVQKIGARWWLVDPEGHRFIDVGVAAVGTGSGPTFQANFKLKFKSKEEWRDVTAEFLRQGGFVGTGAWSQDELMQSGGQRFVYTPNLAWMAGYGKKRGGTYQKPGHVGFPNDCIFVFDPEFEAYVNEQAAKLSARKEDPWLLGYYSDNELPFPNSLLKKYLDLPKEDPGYVAAKQWLAARGKQDAAAVTPEDQQAFLGFVADRYFGLCNRAMKKFDSHHLYLGARLHASERGSAAFMKAAGAHVDVMSINVYHNWSPRDAVREWAGACGKPIMVTEFYARGQDSGMANSSGAGWTVPTQADRGAFYQNFTLDLIESRSCVGWTWFKYLDNDPAQTDVDPSNRDSNKGIVNNQYEPYAPLVEAMRELNWRVYPLVEYFDRDAK